MKNTKTISLLIIFVSVFFVVKSSVYAIPKITLDDSKPQKSTEHQKTPTYASDEVVVRFKKNRLNLTRPGLFTYVREINARLSNNLEKKDETKAGNTITYKIKDGRSVNDVINEIKQNSNVESVSPNYFYKFSDLGTNDTYKDSLWGLDNVGQTIDLGDGTTTVGTNGADIDLKRAWDVSPGTGDVVVAVIDSGVAYEHPDLINKMWDGSVCKDENGSPIYSGCLHGYNFVTGSTDPAPANETHGTHIAGTIAAESNNSLGISGMSSKVKVMALNCDAGGGVSTNCAIKSIYFAIQNGAKVINASFGSTEGYDGDTLYKAIEDFKLSGGIFVAAAGNEGANNDSTPLYPSSYNLDNIISVAATDNNDQLTSFSNYGSNSVDVGAPGLNILSTVMYRHAYVQTFTMPLDINFDVGSSFGVVSFTSGKRGLLGDINYLSGSNYSNNSNYTVTSNTISLSSTSSSPLTQFNFVSRCLDAGTTTSGGSADADYMALEASSDGTNFNEITRWNQNSISAMSASACDSSGCAAEFKLNLDNTYLTNNFKYRFRWVTDASSTETVGCYLYDLQILEYPQNGAGADYDFMNGTSMATPHVAGLAGYLFSYNPTATYTQVVDAINTSGDDLTSLAGKTSTGKRINAYNAIMAIGVTGTPTITPTDTPTVTPTDTPTVTPTDTPTVTPTDTPTVTPTDTPTVTPTITLTPTETPTPTVTIVPTPTPTTAPSAPVSNNTPPGPPPCTDKAPTVNPDLFELRADKGKVTLYYTSAGSVTNGYAFLYGYSKGDERFGAIAEPINNNDGVQHFTIYDLDPKATYYFKVAAINKCDISPWSGWVPVQANRKRTIYEYKTIIKRGVKSLVKLFT
jgi:subtilisin family serine protease